MHSFYKHCAYFSAAHYMRRIEKIAAAIFRPTGLAPAYSYIMLYLEDYGSSSITDIAVNLGYDRTTVSRLVKKLRDKQLVRLKNVGRKTMVNISSEGKIFLITANQCLNELSDKTDYILQEDKGKMTALLSKNTQKLQEYTYYE